MQYMSASVIFKTLSILTEKCISSREVVKIIHNKIFVIIRSPNNKKNSIIQNLAIISN